MTFRITPRFIFLFVFLIYSPVLFNQFVGDDHLLIEKNTFYDKLENIPRLFQSGYISTSQNLLKAPDNNYGTFNVSYAPVFNIMFFIQDKLFGKQSWGYHLTNILIHCFNCLLIYLIAKKLFNAERVGIIASLFFGLHPIQAEAVSVISFQSAVLAPLWILLSFYNWIQFKEKKTSRRKLILAYLFFLLGVFTKESAVIFPFILVLFEIIFFGFKSLNENFKVLWPFGLIMSFYLYVYIFIFPNSSLPFYWLGGSWFSHIFAIVAIWQKYVFNLLFPWTTNLLPGLYTPVLPSFWSIETLEMIACITVTVILLFKFRKTSKSATFFLVWYLFFYLPVSNIIPLANTVAHRFIYLPAVGGIIVFAYLTDQLLETDIVKRIDRRIAHSFLIVFPVFIGIICTLFLNYNYKNDFFMASQWIKNYPDANCGYAILGQQYFNHKQFAKAKEYFEKARSLGFAEMLLDMQLGISYFYTNEDQKAKECFLRAIPNNPQLVDPYIYLANLAAKQHNETDELNYLLKIQELDPKNLTVYQEIMRIRTKQKDKQH